MNAPSENLNRPEQILKRFLAELDKHISEIASGEKEVFYDIHDFAEILCVHPTHLSNTVKQLTGKAPCQHCEGKLAVVAKWLLETTEWSVKEIAVRLTYDPPAFTKFFKKYVGITPTEYREKIAAQ